MQPDAVGDKDACWSAVDGDGGMMKLKAGGVGKSDFENGGCDWDVKWEHAVVGVEGGRKEENLSCVGG